MFDPTGDFDRIESIVARCLDAEHPEAELARLTATRPDLREDARRILDRVRAEYGDLLRVGDDGASPDSEESVPGYRILRVLGSGGMGTVFLAEQQEPVHREVALKVIKRGMDSQQVLRRFELERSMLALLSHENVAKVYDAGATPRGQPYFAMEFVAGVPITTYCEERSLSIDDRLRLLQQVCAGVQYAHQKGVIHRDLKPGNILVPTDRDDPVLKIIDFGLARAVDTDGPDASLLTLSGQILGTPAYMSPEQASGVSDAVDTRTDVYALGVTLYELLTGTLPFPSSELHRAGLSEAMRMIREDDPPKPSARVITIGAATVTATELPGATDGRDLWRKLRGELDWITMKALEKDRDRRYPWPAALADDLQRYLDDEPVVAGPPSTGYRLRKLVRRHRGFVCAAALLLLALTVGFATTLWQFGAARRNEQAAVAARVAEAKKAREALDNLADFRRMADVRRVTELTREATDDLWPAVPAKAERMGEWLAQAETVLARLPVHRRKLAEIETSLARSVAGERAGQDRAELRWQHDVLRELVAGLETWGDRDGGLIASVRERRSIAETLEARSTLAHREAWAATVRAVAASEHYGGLELEPVIGLVPLGTDPDSQLFEFGHLLSGEAAVRDADTGRLKLTPETGIVLVLIPGGRFWMGAQRDDPDGANHDPTAERDEYTSGRPVEVELDPYFLSKYEMTQGQWERIAGTRPCGFGPGTVVPTRAGKRPVTLLHPVESVSWEECTEMLRRLGLVLPTEAQWERGARGGTDTIWWTGDEDSSLSKSANVADAFCKANGGHRSWSYSPAVDDGFVCHAPVGSLQANPFGLHDVHGNVFEWCRARYGGYGESAPRPGDGLREPSNAPNRVNRGGGWARLALDARSANRSYGKPSGRGSSQGCRPACLVIRE